MGLREMPLWLDQKRDEKGCRQATQYQPIAHARCHEKATQRLSRAARAPAYEIGTSFLTRPPQ